jgi:hypothetical protein
LTPPATGSFWERNKERLLTIAVLFLLVYSVIRNILKAAIRPFWFDELCTWILARQPNISALWRALTRAADGNPPPFYLLESLFAKLIPSDHIAYRMPSILAFCLMEWCLFLWLKRRHDRLIAFVAILLPFMTTLYITYSVEARPYCLMAACLALALVAYQRVPALPWVFFLGFSLFAAQAFHFYSIFMMSPFFAAEAVYCLKTKNIRWPVWGALFAGVLPLIAFWKELSSIKSYYSQHFWIHPTFLGMLRIYGWIFGIPQGSPSTFSWPLAAGLLLTAIVLVVSALFLIRALRANPNQTPFFHERVLIAGYLLLPVTVFFAVKLSNGGLTDRYFLPVTLGLVLAAAAGLSYLSGKTVLLLGALLCLTIAIQESVFWISYYGDYQLGFIQPNSEEQLVARADHPKLPVVIADGHDYLELDHYATAQWKQRLVFLSDPAAAAAFGRPDTTERELLVLRDFTSLRVFDYDKFKPSRSEFLVYSHPTSQNDPDWFVLWLMSDGWTLQRLANDGHNSVYLATPAR